jgi:hypothetical protein
MFPISFYVGECSWSFCRYFDFHTTNTTLQYYEEVQSLGRDSDSHLYGPEYFGKCPCRNPSLSRKLEGGRDRGFFAFGTFPVPPIALFRRSDSCVLAPVMREGKDIATLMYARREVLAECTNENTRSEWKLEAKGSCGRRTPWKNRS